MAIMYPSSMPYDDLSFIDQSAYEETTPTLEPVAEIPSGPILFMPFISPKGYGEDNKLVYMDSARLNKYGSPNLKKYGLSLYLANRFVEGGGTVLGMRLMPDDAGYAHKCVYATVAKESLAEYETSITGTYPNQKTVYSPKWKFADEKTGTISEISFDSSAISNGKINFDTFNDNGFEYYTGDLTQDIPAENIKILKLTVKGSEFDTIIAKETVTETTTKTNGDGSASVNTSEYLRIYKLIVGQTETDASIGADGKDKIVSYTIGDKYAELVTSENVIVTYSSTVLNDSSTSDKIVNFVPDGGENVYPMFIAQAKSKGDFAKAFTFKITQDTTMNANNSNYFFYKFSSVDTTTGANLDENMSFTFDDDFVYGSECMSVEDVFETHSTNIKLAKCKGFDTFKDYIKTNCLNGADDADSEFNKLDILFGSNTSGKNLIITHTGGCDFSKYDDNRLSGNSLNGILDKASYADFGSDVNFTDPCADMFVKAFTGEITDLIYDEVRYPFEYLIIPSYTTSIIDAVANLADNRRISRVYPTYPKFSRYEEARDWAVNNLYKYNTWKYSEYCEWAQIRDSYTGKKLMMPSTYFNAYALPYHWLNNKGKPYAGSRNFNWKGFTVGSITPCSTNPQEYINNHNIGLNTMIEDGLGYASPYEQITSQQKAGVTSQLSENNNATILANMARIALRLASEARWTTLSDDEIRNYISNVQYEISMNLGGTYKNLTVNGERESVNGAGRNRIHCKLYVNFNDLLKGVTYEFYILAN